MAAVRRAAAWLLYVVGASRVARWLNREKLVVVCYHGVTLRRDGVPGDAAGLQVHPYTFRSDDYYLSPSYNGDPAAEYARFIGLGVDAFFTDFPALGVKVRDAYLAR